MINLGGVGAVNWANKVHKTQEAASPKVDHLKIFFPTAAKKGDITKGEIVALDPKGRKVQDTRVKYSWCQFDTETDKEVAFGNTRTIKLDTRHDERSYRIEAVATLPDGSKIKASQMIYIY